MTAPFSHDEIALAGSYPPAMFGGVPVKRFKTPVSPRENYLRMYRRETPLWIPIPNDKKSFSPWVDPDAVARCFIMDAVYQQPEQMTGGKDKHGIEWVYVPSARGSMVRPGAPFLKDANDWETVAFPDLASWDWDGTKSLNAEILAGDERLVSVTILTGFFERLISLMDFDKAAVAMIDEDQKDAVQALFSKLADMYCQMLGRYKEAYGIQQVNFHDDWGAQTSPFFSLATVREMILPHLSRVVDCAHSLGVYFDMHSCGKNEKLITAYIDAGVDSWSGQPMNDKKALHAAYGDKIILGCDPDTPITADTPEEDVIACAKRFAAHFLPTYDKKPVIAAGVAVPLYYEVIYEESRKYFAGL